VITFNVNSEVWVRLRPAGLLAYKRHWEHYKCKPPPLRVRGGWVRFQWELAQIFGSALYNGCEVPFDTTIRLEEP
jgi:hypothetical protein